MAYMNTSVTRGRGELIVTATGMDTEIGHIADLLANTETDKTPLQKQLDGLSKIIAIDRRRRAGARRACSAWLRGESFDTLFITGVALAVAAIPTGLPAVVTALLSMGTREIARRNAIVKRLPGGRDAGLDVGDLLGQDRHPDPEQDDGPRAGRSPARTASRSPARATAPPGEIKHVGGSAHRPRPLPAADGPVRRRRARRREPDRRPDRGRADRARRQGRPGHRRDPAGLPAGRRGPVRLRVQVHGDLPRDDRRTTAARSCAATSRARPTC